MKLNPFKYKAYTCTKCGGFHKGTEEEWQNMVCKNIEKVIILTTKQIKNKKLKNAFISGGIKILEEKL